MVSFGMMEIERSFRWGNALFRSSYRGLQGKIGSGCILDVGILIMSVVGSEETCCGYGSRV